MTNKEIQRPTTNDQRLFTPYQLGPVTLRNRIIRSAAFENMARGNAPTQQLQDYHVSVARGGVGMTTVAYCAVDLSGVSFDGQLYVRPEIIPDMKKMTDAIHAEGAKASIQLGHCGNMTHFYTCHCMPVSADTWFNLYSPTIHRRLKVAEIKQLVKKFGEAVDWSRECGFDCVEIHAGHAYLISQFLAPRTNHRHDEYGGSFENRCRFPLELVAALREAVGPDYPLIMRVAGNEFMKGGNTNEECVEFCKLLEKAGIDMINVTGGWALLTFILITYYKFKAGPLIYIKSFGDPVLFLAPLNIISEVATPISMAFRHYGNVLSGSIISILIANLLTNVSKMIFGFLPGYLGGFPYLRVGLPAILSIYFDLFSGALQAFIFAMLTMLNISGAVPWDDWNKKRERRGKETLAPN